MFVGRGQELSSPAEMHSDGSRPHPTLGQFPAHERGGNNRLRSLRTLGKFPVFLRLPKKSNFETLPISPCNPVPSPLDLHCKSLASTLSHPPARAYFESSAEDPDQGGSTL